MFWTVYQFSYYSIIARRINEWIFVRVHFLLLLTMIRGAMFNWLSKSLNSLKVFNWYTLHARVLANICSLYLLGLLFVLRQSNILSVRKYKCDQSLHRYLYHVSHFLYQLISVNYTLHFFISYSFFRSHWYFYNTPSIESNLKLLIKDVA